MHTDIVRMAKADAKELHRKYREHAAYSTPIDWEIQRTYDLIARGKVIIQAFASIKNAGLNREFLPKLALTAANAKHCHLHRNNDGSIQYSPNKGWSRSQKNVFHFRVGTFNFPRDSFPRAWDGKGHRSSDDHAAVVPDVPLHLRPKRGLPNYHILFEAEWTPVPPKDPLLLRRIGKADLWLVVAHWELTEVERAALSTRV